MVSPDGKVLIQATEDEEVLMVADIDPLLARNKELNPLNNLFDDRRPEMYWIDNP
jgi:5-aminopentanamidase